MEDDARKLEPATLSSLSGGGKERPNSDQPASAPPPRASPSRRVRAWRRFVTLERGTVRVLAVIAVLLIAARIALPFVVKHFINKRLAELEGYSGRVDDVDISLLSAAYAVDRLRIVKTDGEVPVPFVAVERIDLLLDWGELLKGRILAEVQIDRPVLNFVVAGGGSGAQTGEEADWRGAVKDLVPITVHHLIVRGGEIHYRDFGSRPRLHMRVDRISAVAEGLSTERRPDGRLPARVHVDARVQRSGRLVADARLDPWKADPTFNLSLRMRRLPAREINPMLRAYAGVDAEGGSLFLYSELRARNGRFRGYVKPMAESLSIFRFDEDGDFLDKVGDALVGLVVQVFSNWKHDRLAVVVPVSGSFSAPETDGWAIVGSVLYNMIIRAIRHGLDDQEGWRPDGELAANDG